MRVGQKAVTRQEVAFGARFHSVIIVITQNGTGTKLLLSQSYFFIYIQTKSTDSQRFSQVGVNLRQHLKALFNLQIENHSQDKY